uniref:ORF59d n=1 Tax=Pinus koraiensis TaxID=88728 RepID=A4QMG8_PINKO|nr:ORF59d [Pinus koraiensis]
MVQLFLHQSIISIFVKDYGHPKEKERVLIFLNERLEYPLDPTSHLYLSYFSLIVEDQYF